MKFSADQLERYSRHFVLSEIGVKGQKRLLESKVLVVGAGALGSVSLMYLAAAGVGTIGIADDDAVTLSNLQRQIIHRTENIGMEKIQSAKQTIASINPDVNVILHHTRLNADNCPEIIAPYDFIIDSTDSFESKFLINDGCVLSKKPYVHGGVVRFSGQAMTYIPGEGPCLRCILEGVPPREEDVTCTEAGVVGAATGIIGSIEAMEAIKYLLGMEKDSLLVGRVLHFDGLKMSFQTMRIPKASPDCSVCGSDPTIRSLDENRADYEPIPCCDCER